MKNLITVILAIVMLFTSVYFSASAQEVQTTGEAQVVDNTTFTTLITLEDVIAGAATLEDYQAQQTQRGRQAGSGRFYYILRW